LGAEIGAEIGFVLLNVVACEVVSSCNLGALRRAPFFGAEKFAAKGVCDFLEGRENFRISTPGLQPEKFANVLVSPVSF